jgi:hypothetical protein
VRILKRNGKDPAHYAVAVRMVRSLAAHERSISHANCSCSKPHSARTILLQLQLCAQSAPSYHAQPFISLFALTALLQEILKKAVTSRGEFLGQFFSLQVKKQNELQIMA